MIRIKYSKGEIDFSGFSNDYQKLRDQIVEFVSSSEAVFSIVVDSNFDPSPYDYALKQLVFVKSDSLLCDLREGDILRMISFPEGFLVFANSLPVKEDGEELPDGYHHHFDDIGFPQEVSTQCASIVFSLRENG
jgi:hypothetical protein